MIQPDNDTELKVANRDKDTRSQLIFASDYARTFPWGQWLLLPPTDAEKLLPIPPGSVRAKWMTAAIGSADIGKDIAIVNGSITLNGEPRNVTWGEEATPENATGVIQCADQSVGGDVLLESGHSFSNPAIVGRNDSVEADLAFASVRLAWRVRVRVRLRMRVRG